MRRLPDIGVHDLDAALVVRTDFGDEPVWRAVVAELRQPWGMDEEHEARVHIVDDPAWSGATVREVRAAARAADRTVFIADATAVRHPHFALLAVDLDAGEDTPPQEDRFRVEPAAVQEVHMQRFIDNLSFADFVDKAARDSENVVWSPY
ncbi:MULTISPECIES: DUF6924 domain-containing protein [unclassified Streptomyces]|jgi:hypothetical protein|uniref:DUF6924 domain-containing protein n=1 Tax=unclassified Streptomyces TaxID=2593676 RepID=UPI0033347B6E